MWWYSSPPRVPDQTPDLRIGDPIFFHHAKAGELAEHFNEFCLVRREEIVDRVKIYPGEGTVFLRGLC
jgi:D-serine deaminase-like pyridoxal phosphate-dependent protein